MSIRSSPVKSRVLYYGWFGGGFPYPSAGIVDRITLSDDTTNAIDRCDLSVKRSGMGGISNSTYGWFGGGYTIFNNVDRITLSNDTATAIDRCDLTLDRFGLEAIADDTYGWFIGGRSVSAGIWVDTIERITLADDTTNAIPRCVLTSAKYVFGAFTDSIHGWFGGGDDGAVYLDVVERITLADDTVNAIPRCTLTIPKSGSTGFTDNTYGWFGGGDDALLYYNEIERITIANDTVNAVYRSDLFLARTGHAAFTDGTYGWFGGGKYGSSSSDVTNMVDRITIANDTVNALDRCDLVTARSLPPGFIGSV